MTEAAAEEPDRQEAMLSLMKVPEAWEITRGRDDVVVGVIDNGFDFYHPALRGKLIPGWYYEGGYHPETLVVIAHGTLVSGIIVAQRTGTDGITGLAPDCSVLTVSQGTIEHALLRQRSEFSKTHPEATPAEERKARAAAMEEHPQELDEFAQNWVRYQTVGASRGIRYLVDHGVKVINVSGLLRRSFCDSTDLWEELGAAFAYAAEKNVVVVLGAGNDATNVEDYPGSADTVVVAGASNLDDTRWDTEVEYEGATIKQGSSFGHRLTVMAPTEQMRVCMPHEPRFYSCDDGPAGQMKQQFEGMYATLPHGATSCAAPIVSSLAALVLSARPDMAAPDVVQIIKEASDDPGAKGYNIHTGHGRVNFAMTLSRAVAWRK